MKFSEAMQKLQEGAKVSRPKWNAPLFFKLVDGQAKCFQGNSSFYSYDESIFLSDGWKIDGLEEEFTFSEIIPHLLKGAKARLKDWKDTYIYADSSAKCLLLKSIIEHSFSPDLESLMAQDWIVIE